MSSSRTSITPNNYWILRSIAFQTKFLYFTSELASQKAAILQVEHKIYHQIRCSIFRTRMNKRIVGTWNRATGYQRHAEQCHHGTRVLTISKWPSNLNLIPHNNITVPSTLSWTAFKIELPWYKSAFFGRNAVLGPTSIVRCWGRFRSWEVADSAIGTSAVWRIMHDRHHGVHTMTPLLFNSFFSATYSFRFPTGILLVHCANYLFVINFGFNPPWKH